MFAYCRNNPVNHSDPNGDWVVDAIFLITDIASLVSQPSLENLGWVALSAVCFLDATGISSTAIHSAKTIHGAAETIHSVKKMSNSISVGIKSTKVSFVSGTAHGSVGHKAAINSKVRSMGKSGKYSKIYVNKSLKTAGLKGTERPDVTGIKVDGGVDIFEYASQSQLKGKGRNNLINKFNRMKNNNPGSGGKIFW